MENRKEQIANLEREIEQKQQTLNELRTAEDNQEPEDIDVTQEDIDEVVNNILL